MVSAGVLSVDVLPEYLDGVLVDVSSLGVVLFVVVLLLEFVGVCFVIEVLPPYLEAIRSMVLGVSGGSRLVDLA